MTAFVAIRSDVGFAVYEDVAPHCNLLRASGLTVGSLTNGNCDVTQSGGAFGELFDFSLTAADAGAEKPGLAPFLHAVRHAGLEPQASGGPQANRGPQAGLLLALKCEPCPRQAAAAGVHPCAVVHVGDSIRSDLLGARCCGRR